MRGLGRFLVSVSLAVAAAVDVLADVPGWRPYPQTDPVEMASLRLDPTFALAPEKGDWSTAVVFTQFNLWGHTWHISEAHRSQNLYRQPILDEELREVERKWAQDNVYHFDLEGWRADVVIARGFGRDGAVVVRIPWIYIGAPHWDSFPETVHDFLDVSSLGREVFPRGDTFIYLKDRFNRHIVKAGRELNGGGPGDVALAASFPAAPLWGGESRIAAVIELPTGRRDSIRGSGGYDLGIGWFGTWKGERRTWRAAAGFSRLDRNGSFFGYKRADVGHLLGEVEWPLRGNLRGTASVRVDSSPLAAVTGGHAGHPPTYYRFGLSGDLPGGGWFTVDVGQELLPQTGVEADWSLHVTVGRDPGRGQAAGTQR